MVYFEVTIFRGEMSNNDEGGVNRLRFRFAINYDFDEDLYHINDVHRVHNEDWQVRRFLINCYNEEEKAYEQLTKALKWKKSFGVHDRSDDYFPKEFYLLFNHEKFSRDHFGRVVNWNIENRYRRIPGFSQLIEQFLAHLLEKLDREAGPNGWITFNDCSNMEQSSYDMELSKARNDMFNYYPGGLHQNFNVDMPTMMKTVMGIFKEVMSDNIKNSLAMISKEEISQYVDPWETPTCFGGQRPCCVNDMTGLKPLKDCHHLGLTQQQIDQFYKHLLI